MQRDPPVIRNAFLGNTGNYSFAARSLPAIATEPSSVALFSSPFPFLLVTFLPPWRCFTGSLPPRFHRSAGPLLSSHTFLGIFCFRWTSFRCFVFASSTFDHLSSRYWFFFFNFFFFFFFLVLFCAKKSENDFWGVIFDIKRRSVFFCTGFCNAKVTMFVDWFWWYEVKVVPDVFDGYFEVEIGSCTDWLIVDW